MHIVWRDLRKRVASAGMMVGVVAWSGNPIAGYSIGAVIVIIELSVIVLRHIMPKKDTERALFIGLVFWSINAVSMLVFRSFSVVLVTHSSMALVLAGYLWLFGTYVHVSKSFSFLPIYNWGLMPPAFIAAFVLFYLSSQNEVTAGTRVEWLIAAVLMVIYIANTIETMEKHNDTQAALAQARSEAVARLNELEYLTRHDKLTGLQNRFAFDEALDELLLDDRRIQGLAIYLIDLDDFKPINDSYGHMAGDAVLVAAANSLMRNAGADAIVAQLGGDEFAVIAPNVPSDAAAVRLGYYFERGINAPIRFKDKQLRVGASVGIARSNVNFRTAKELLAGADQAMYAAKADPNNKSVLYDRQSFPTRPSLEDRNNLFHAISEGQIIPYYQPKICSKTFKIIGFEALSRWAHPTRGILNAREFVPQINDFGLQGELLMHMARHVLVDMAEIHQTGQRCGQISINVPEVTLATISGRSDLAHLINKYAYLKNNLTLEITEDVFISRSGDLVQRAIKAFRDEGIRISLDDFGTGFASFQHLRELEFNELKLDKDFVKGLGVDPKAAVLGRGIMEIGKGLGIQVVAEGVENLGQLDLLVEMGCEVVQGHLSGAAVPANEALALLKAGRVHLGGRSEDAA
ncbi:MAG: EAL domain-containing protein [Yoonia sp.]|nr:EAL domain-containing protein [Yoonia sp.]